MTTRLLWSYLTLAVFVLAILEIPLGFTFARNEQAQLSSAIERDATVIAGVAEDTLERGVATDLTSVVDRYGERTGGRVVIVDAQGVSVADSDPPAPGRRDFSSRTEIRAALAGARRQWYEVLGHTRPAVAVGRGSGRVRWCRARRLYASPTRRRSWIAG